MDLPPPPPSAALQARAACLADISAALLAALAARASVNINRLKQSLAAKHGLGTIPKLIEVIAALPEQHRDRLAPFLRTKPVRSASGVAVVAVMCKPHRCPHLAFTGGVCVYWCAGRARAVALPPAPRRAGAPAAPPPLTPCLFSPTPFPRPQPGRPRL